ncbi:ArsR/SmtB family transcription factor [Leptospira wolffii]|uniref:ArsR family transcriptional regulator n=1 Tax=Leptospira wolffii TaxID=409998 RepID=A0A2M9Z8Q0_9LEPT|nr:metalloregulator ArsR/SmtB family transcription factor [Leptospira wolffii]EPG66954.1 transcriptional regulator, ArsR family [Leptospira wolffii serovar Khorat str. Khorat-H2]PJZ64798.1 ArsR family transcriptional regulator [Leptospira wolffii]TGK56904.1 ArsR family transcriptional regulator [Leptospira wolffii]TGK71514.1 ArsR family transcriptional regulator [Leptospira wolffii]TGK75630.1 ArsR family transcriptional regulator [Leptospira wolffii]
MQALDAIADPTRRKILELLFEGELGAGEIAGHFDISQAAISQHLKVLRDCHLIQARVDGQRRIHSLDYRGWKEIQDWLDRAKNFWEGRLDALEKELRANKMRKEKR